MLRVDRERLALDAICGRLISALIYCVPAAQLSGRPWPRCNKRQQEASMRAQTSLSSQRLVRVESVESVESFESAPATSSFSSSVRRPKHSQLDQTAVLPASGRPQLMSGCVRRLSGPFFSSLLAGKSLREGAQRRPHFLGPVKKQPVFHRQTWAPNSNKLQLVSTAAAGQIEGLSFWLQTGRKLQIAVQTHTIREAE